MFKDNTVQLTLTPAEVDYLGNLLTDRPIKEALPLLTKMQQQVNAQRLPDPPPEVPPITAPTPEILEDTPPSVRTNNGADQKRLRKR